MIGLGIVTKTQTCEYFVGITEISEAEICNSCDKILAVHYESVTEELGECKCTVEARGGGTILKVGDRVVVDFERGSARI